MYAHTQRLAHAQGPPWDHTGSLRRSLSSPPIDYCYILWLDWTTPDNVSHRLYSYSTRSHPPSLTHPIPSFCTSSPAPPTSFLCLPFISFHLSSLLIPPLASECEALMVRPLLDINPYLPPLHIFMLTNDLQRLPFLGQYSLYTLYRFVHWAPQSIRYTGVTWIAVHTVRFSFMFFPKRKFWNCVYIQSTLPIPTPSKIHQTNEMEREMYRPVGRYFKESSMGKLHIYWYT